MNEPSWGSERRRRIVTRAAPIALLALAAFVFGLIAGAAAGKPDEAQRFADAWAREDYEAMYAELTPGAQETYSLEEFEAAYEDAASTATIASVAAGEADGDGDAVAVPVTIETRIFGSLGATLELPTEDGLIAWEPHLVFPELAEGERLTRRTRAPQRAAILAADGSALARGPASAREIPATASLDVVGEVGAPKRAQQEALAARGFPPGSPTGITGLELAFDERLAGRPGGQLLAAPPRGSPQTPRVLAASEPEPGKPVRTFIDPVLQEAAVSALGSLYGGVAVLDARKGSVLALAGIAYSAPQPPGSTFKVITTTAALDAGIVELSDSFPVEVSNSEIGREIANSHDTPCGGTFAESFARSCNTVFAPLGAEVGGEKLVETAEAYGFNSTPTLFDARGTAAVDPPASTLPTELSSSVEVGETAIGQGQVLATPLQMATVSQVIASEGVRMPTPIARDPGLQADAGPVEVTSEQTASTLRELMIGVVRSGTGIAAQVPGVEVAGKTGTAELGPAALAPGDEVGPGEEPALEEDAWFTAFAPAGDPQLAVAVMIVNASGDGGTVAAPIAQQVLAAGLG